MSKGSATARKSAARLAAVQVLYQMRLNRQDAASALKDFSVYRAGKKLDGDSYVEPDADLLSDIVRGAEARWADVDGVVTKTLSDGGRESVEILLDCILRAGVFELLARAETPHAVIINDYLSVSASFYEGGETRLVNGILDRAAKVLRG